MATPDLGIDANLNGAIPLDSNSEWNTVVLNAPLMADSAQIIAAVNPVVGIHPDFGSGLYYGIPIGIDYVIVPYDQPLVPFIDNLFASESDPGPFPIPTDAPLQGVGAQGYNDHHLIVVQQDPNSPTGFGEEYDFFGASQNADGTWQGYSAEFNLNLGDDQRPFGWGAATASGLPLFPGLLKYDEVQQAIAENGANGYVDHALAFTLSPWLIGTGIFGAAEHTTENGDGLAGYGMHFRLNPDYVVSSSLPIEDQVILNTLKVYGMILVDGGGNFFLSGVPDSRWNDSDLSLLQTAVTGSDFQVVDTSTLHTPVPISVGSGSDSIVLTMSENYYLGNAQFTVSIDGNPMGGILNTTATMASGNTQTFTFNGNFGPGQHNVVVSFVNPTSDANGTQSLFLDGITFDGSTPLQPITSPLSISSTTPSSFSVGNVTNVGTGSDTLILAMCEDAYLGVDAQFTLSIDGVQIGGVQTVSTTRTMGRTQDFVFQGNWGSEQHVVAVNFLNGVSDPTSGGGRNLFLWDTNYDGTDYASATANLYGGGTTTLQIGNPLVIGSGSDSLQMNICEDAANGTDVQFEVLVNGIQVGGIETATQYRSTGHTQTFTFNGNWGPNVQNVSVDVLNGGGVRNLYVWGMTYDGTNYSSNQANLYGGGNASFQVGTPQAIGSGPDSLVLTLSESTYSNDAQYIVFVDGVQVAGTQTESVLLSSGKTEQVTFDGSWGGGQHNVVVQQVNSNGLQSLFIQGVSYDGNSLGSMFTNLYLNHSASFTVTGPTPPPAPAPAVVASASVGSSAIAVISSSTVMTSSTMSLMTPSDMLSSTTSSASNVVSAAVATTTDLTSAIATASASLTLDPTVVASTSMVAFDPTVQASSSLIGVLPTTTPSTTMMPLTS